MAEPGWLESIVFWHVYPLGFSGADTTGADRSAAGGLDRVTAWLDYAAEMGAGGLLLGPVFESSSHGYDTVDPFRIDARLGGQAAFDRLIAAARARGLRVLLDGVFNHVGREFPAFWRVEHGEAAEGDHGWFRPSDAPGSAAGHATFEGHPGLVALNHDAPAVADHVTAVMEHWLARGADGWRLDAAYAVDSSFWARVLPRVRATHPEAYFVGEVIHGDYAQIVSASGMDAVTQYELWKAIWSALNDANFYELAHALERHAGYLDSFVPLTFVGNHDVTRLASVLKNPAHIAHALVVLFTVGGTPAVYAGDEQAFRGTKEARVGGDDAVRPAFPDSPSDLALSGWPIHRLHRQLIAARVQRPWLHRAAPRTLELANEQFSYELTDGDRRVVVALNLAARPQGIALQPDDRGWNVLLGAEGSEVRDGRLTVGPRGWAIAAPE